MKYIKVSDFLYINTKDTRLVVKSTNSSLPFRPGTIRQDLPTFQDLDV